MLFAKNETQTAAPQEIAILGSSALGLFLATELQKADHRVRLICRPHEIDEINATEFIIKNNQHLTGRRYNIDCVFELTATPQILFIASEPEDLRGDLLLLSPARLTETQIIDLSVCTPTGLISEILHRPVISGYFNGWLKKDKNHISLLSNHPSLTLTLNPTTPAAAQADDIFAGTMIELRRNEEDAQNLWNWLAPRAAAILLGTALGKKGQTLSKSAEGRKMLDSCLDELAILAAADNAGLERGAVLTAFYNIPEEFPRPFPAQTAAALLRLERLNALLFRTKRADSRRFPVISGLLEQIRNNL